MSPENSERTAGELGRRFDEIANRLEGLLVRLDATYVRQDLWRSEKDSIEGRWKQEVDALKDRTTAIESRQEWVIRTVGAVVIMAVLGTIFLVRTGGLMH